MELNNTDEMETMDLFGEPFSQESFINPRQFTPKSPDMIKENDPATPNTSPSDEQTERPLRLDGEQEDCFRILRKLIYKRHLAKYIQGEVTKGLQIQKHHIRISKPELNLVEPTRIPQDFQKQVSEILLDAERKLNNLVVDYYKEIIPDLETEWEFTVQSCNTRFGPTLTEAVVKRAKKVAQEYLKNRLQKPPQPNFRKPKFDVTNPRRRSWSQQPKNSNNKQENKMIPLDKLLEIMKSLQ